MLVTREFAGTKVVLDSELELFTVCPGAGCSTRTERPAQEGAAGIRQKRSAIERRSTTRIAAYDIFPSEDAAATQPDAVNLPGRNSQTAVGKNEQNLAAVGDQYGF